MLNAQKRASVLDAEARFLDWQNRVLQTLVYNKTVFGGNAKCGVVAVLRRFNLLVRFLALLLAAFPSRRSPWWMKFVWSLVLRLPPMKRLVLRVRLG